jgi:DNA modification methylase
MSDRLTILCGDSADELATLSAGSAHLAVTSPPYDRLRTYGGDCEWDFERTAVELFRVLCAGGVLCWNVGDSVVSGAETLTSCKQKIFFVERCGFRVHDTMIWHKRNFSNPESVRYHQVFEYVFVLSKGKPRVFNPIKDKPNVQAGRVGCNGVNTFIKRDGTRSTRTTHVTQEFGMRGNVWVGNTRGQEEFCKKLPHPAMMPRWLARDLIISFSNPGDLVVDPFGGSGTTVQEALELGRSALLIDSNPSFCDLVRRSAVEVGLPLV